MKIIFSTPADKIAEHAKTVVSEAQKKSQNPIGVPSYSAQVPEWCEDCGATYWHKNDPYGWFPHIGCRNAKSGNLGF